MSLTLKVLSIATIYPPAKKINTFLDDTWPGVLNDTGRGLNDTGQGVNDTGQGEARGRCRACYVTAAYILAIVDLAE